MRSLCLVPLLLAACAAQPGAATQPMAQPVIGRFNSLPDVDTQSPPGTTEGSLSPAAQFQTPNSLPPGAGTIVRP